MRAHQPPVTSSASVVQHEDKRTSSSRTVRRGARGWTSASVDRDAGGSRREMPDGRALPTRSFLIASAGASIKPLDTASHNRSDAGLIRTEGESLPRNCSAATAPAIKPLWRRLFCQIGMQHLCYVWLSQVYPALAGLPGGHRSLTHRLPRFPCGPGAAQCDGIRCCAPARSRQGVSCWPRANGTHASEDSSDGTRRHT